jgi:hypothetical protein
MLSTISAPEVLARYKVRRRLVLFAFAIPSAIFLAMIMAGLALQWTKSTMTGLFVVLALLSTLSHLSLRCPACGKLARDPENGPGLRAKVCGNCGAKLRE